MGSHAPGGKTGELTKDISLFVRIQLDGDVRIFLLGGCLTLGVLGAAKAFLGESRAVANARFIESRASGRDVIVAWETSRVGSLAQTADFTSAEPVVVLVREGESGGFALVIDHSEAYAVER